MATDATGTPTTNFSFPTYNVDADAPSGIGLNNIIADVDSKLFTKFPNANGAGLGIDEVAIWNGSAWVYQKIANANIDAAAAIVQSKLAFDAVQTYTPSWSSSGTAPAIGNGTLAGRWFQVGKMVWAQAQMNAGSTTTFGTGDWRLSLPVTASGTIARVGSCAMFDSSAASFYIGWSRWNGTILQFRTSAAPTVLVDANNPFVWAQSDSLSVDIWYEAA